MYSFLSQFYKEVQIRFGRFLIKRWFIVTERGWIEKIATVAFNNYIFPWWLFDWKCRRLSRLNDTKLFEDGLVFKFWVWQGGLPKREREGKNPFLDVIFGVHNTRFFLIGPIDPLLLPWIFAFTETRIECPHWIRRVVSCCIKEKF